MWISLNVIIHFFFKLFFSASSSETWNLFLFEGLKKMFKRNNVRGGKIRAATNNYVDYWLFFSLD